MAFCIKNLQFRISVYKLRETQISGISAGVPPKMMRVLVTLISQLETDLPKILLGINIVLTRQGFEWEGNMWNQNLRYYLPLSCSWRKFTWEKACASVRLFNREKKLKALRRSSHPPSSALLGHLILRLGKSCPWSYLCQLCNHIRGVRCSLI